MNIFMRTFNNKINSKTGVSLQQGQYRGTPEWLVFQDMLVECLRELGHFVSEQPENPLIQEEKHTFGCDKKIYVHQCLRDKPEGDLFWMQMHMKYLFTLDSRGWGCDHSAYPHRMKEFVEEDSEQATDFCYQLSDELHASKESKIEQPTDCDQTPPRFILVPVQIPRDYTIKHHSPITVKYFIDSIQAWAVETMNHVCFKMHPCNAMDCDLHQAIDEAAEKSHFIHKVEGNIHELIKRAEGVFVINSGTGFEALVHGKPVVTFGQSDYNLVSHNGDLRRLDEARNFIYSYKDEFRRLGYQFVRWYHTKHAYDVRNVLESKERLTEYLGEVL
jgi:hypothetical protein